MADCVGGRRVSRCGETGGAGTGTHDDSSYAPCKPFEAKVQGGILRSDGRCLSFTSDTSIPNGTYSSFTLQDGIIVGAAPGQLPTYTPPECCGPAGGGSGVAPSTDIPISPRPCNLLSHQPDGYFAGLSVSSSSTADITGCGTAESPLTVNVTASGSSSIVASGTLPISVSGVGTPSSPLNVAMVPGPLRPGQYGGFMINNYGLVTGYTDPGQQPISLLGIPPIAVSSVGPLSWQISFSGLQLTGDDFISIQKVSDANYRFSFAVPDGTLSNLTIGAYNIVVTQYGLIKEVTRVVDPIVAGKFATVAAVDNTGNVVTPKIVSYNTDGTITAVEASSGTTTGVPNLIIAQHTTSSSSGGTFAAGAWRIRPLNNVVQNTITGAAVDTGNYSVSLPAGSYEIDAWAVACGVGGHQLALATTDNNIVFVGSSAASGEDSGFCTTAVLTGTIVLTAQGFINLRHQCATTTNDYGYGNTTNFNAPNIYASLKIRKV